jgi:hypothetical protein
MFLWLLSHNKLAIVDNMRKRGIDKPKQCCFCTEKESIIHLFFECDVARVIWGYISELLGVDFGKNYLSIATK